MNHYWQTLEHFFWFKPTYEKIFKELPADRPTLWVEVGVFHGGSLAWLGVEAVNSDKDLSIVGVDNFAGWPGVARGDVLRRSFDKNVAPLHDALGHRFRVLAQPSVEAAATFTDESCDVIWLDADHSYAAVRADIEAWWPKVRPGGILGGDDYHSDLPGVMRAVRERFGDVPSPGIRNGRPYACWLVRKPEA
jgi:cephalosporin hydroxylase